MYGAPDRVRVAGGPAGAHGSRAEIYGYLSCLRRETRETYERPDVRPARGSGRIFLRQRHAQRAGRGAWVGVAWASCGSTRATVCPVVRAGGGGCGVWPSPANRNAQRRVIYLKLPQRPGFGLRGAQRRRVGVRGVPSTDNRADAAECLHNTLDVLMPQNRIKTVP